MTGVGLLGSLGLSIGLFVFVFWQARRAASASDGELAATKHTGELDLALAARGRAIEDRDRVIDALKADVQRLEASVKLLIAQRDQAPIKDSNDATDAIRDALRTGDGLLPMP